jgi:alanine racemase
MYTTTEIASITNSKLKGQSNLIYHYFVDSRQLQNPDQHLFIAIRTERNDGHHYIQELVDRGVKSFLVEEGYDETKIIGTNLSFIKTEKPLLAIQRLAAHHRQQFHIPIIGITGSNGKTIVKEWLYQLLKSQYSICRSPKSYNSQIGVPLSVLNLNAMHTLGIFEAGISTSGEMGQLAKIISPTIGVFTALGDAHSQGFDSLETKLIEKFKLFEHASFCVINEVNFETPSGHILKNILRVGKLKGDLTFMVKQNAIEFKYLDKSFEVNTNLTDDASVSNIATCVGVLLYLQFSIEQIQEGIKQLNSIALRLEIKNGIKNSLIINDFYNSDFDSLKIALNFLEQQHRRLKKIVVLSDIEQSGILSQQLYKNIAQLISNYKIDLLIAIGHEIGNFKYLFSSTSIFYKDTSTFISQFKLIDFHFSNATVLLKGARSFGFESMSKLLQQKSHDTIFEINLNKIIENINHYRSLIKPTTIIMAMIKATGYGSGSSEIAKTLQFNGIHYLAVAYADEGVELRESQIKLPIMVMNPELDSFDDIINYQLEPEIYSFRVLTEFSACLDKYGVVEPYPIHLKLDTGMHRLGFEETDLEELIKYLKNTPNLKIVSAFSHLVGSDNKQLDDFSNQQIRLFEKMANTIELATGQHFLKHICNSGGISRFKEAHYDMVRLGIGMYGIGVNEAEQKQLQHVGKLSTKISQLKHVKKGDTIGYNRNGKLEKDTTIATIPIGYADGFSRQLGNGKHGVYINNHFCRTVGNICMDMCMIDVSNVGCKEGDEVIIFENNLQLIKTAEALGTITYEVLTSVSSRVKRIYVQE